MPDKIVSIDRPELRGYEQDIRILRPYRYRAMGIGMNPMDRNPSSEHPQSSPRVVNMAFAKMGNPAPIADRARSLPAYTEPMYLLKKH